MENILLPAFVGTLFLLIVLRLKIRTRSRKAEAWLMLAIFFLNTAIPMGIVGIGNIQWLGILDKSIVDKNDPVVVEDKLVADLQAEGLRTGDIVRFTIPFRKGINQDELKFVYRFSKELEKKFYEYDVLGVANSSKYRVTEDEYLTDEYLRDDVLTYSFSLSQFMREMDKDQRMKDYLIGGEYKCAHVYLLLPRGYPEMETYREIKSFLEGRELNIIQAFLNSGDIYLKSEYKSITDEEKVLVSGWAVGRGLMTDATTADVLWFSFFGQIMAFVVFAFFFASWRQAIIASSMVWLSFLWILGTVGLVLSLHENTNFEEYFNLRVYVRIYIVLVCSSNIVSGISFAERKLSFYNYLRRKHGLASRATLWAMTRPVNEKIFFTGLVAFLNFVLLYQIGVGPIFEVGFLSASGIVYLLLKTHFFIPAMHIVIGGEKDLDAKSAISRPAIWLNDKLEKVVIWIYFRLDPDPREEYNPKKPMIVCMSILAAVFFLAATIVAIDLSGLRSQKFIEVRTKPLLYLNDTNVHRAYDYLKSIDEGFENLCILVRPKYKDKFVSDPSYIAELDRLIVKIDSHEEAKAVYSALDALSVVSREDYGIDIPETQEDAEIAFEEVADMIGKAKEHLWYDGGVVLFVSVQMDDSSKLSKLVDFIKSLRAGGEFSDLEMILFGKGFIWPHNDRMISVRKPINAASSYVMMYVLFFLAILYKNHQLASSKRFMSPWLTAFALSLPFIFSSSIMLIAMAVLRLPLDQATACSASLAVSAAVDFSIYPVADYQEKILSGVSRREALYYALVEKGEEVVMDVFLNCVCFLILTLSNFIPIQNLGLVMIAMLLACGIGSLIIMISLLPFCVREVSEKRRVENENMYIRFRNSLGL